MSGESGETRGTEGGPIRGLDVMGAGGRVLRVSLRGLGRVFLRADPSGWGLSALPSSLLPTAAHCCSLACCSLLSAHHRHHGHRLGAAQSHHYHHA